MVRSFFIALLEVRTYLRDKGDLAFSLLLPIAIFALMYGAFGGQTQFNGTAYIANEDKGPYSTIFLDRLNSLGGVEVQTLSLSDADNRLGKSDILMVIIIPPGFSDHLSAGQNTELIFKQRGNGGTAGQIVASFARSVAEDISQEIQVKSRVGSALAGRNISPQQIDITVQKFLDREHEAPIVSVVENLIGTQVDPVRQFLPGITTMFVLFAVTLTSRALIEERKKGTLERLLTTRLSVQELFVGKFLANVLRGFVQIFILLVLAYIAFRVFTPLSFGEALVIGIVFTAAASAIGLFIGSISRSEDQAVWIAVFFTMSMVMLSGTFFPISEGSVLYSISKISINTYANYAFNSIINGTGSLGNLGLQLEVLGGVAVVGLLLSRVFFRATSGGK